MVSAEDILLEFIATILIVVFLGGITLAANLSDRDHNARWRRVVLISLLSINGMIILLYGVMQLAQAYYPASDSDTEIDKTAAWGAFFSSFIIGVLATMLMSSRVRTHVAFLFPCLSHRPRPETSTDDPGVYSSPSPFALTPRSGRSLFPQMLNYYTDEVVPVDPATGWPSESRDSATTIQRSTLGFDPQSTVHAVALVFIVYMLGVQFVGFALEGGLSGVAENLEDSVNGWTLLINMLPLVVLPVLGVGFATRRTTRATFERLGLGVPSLQGLAASAGLTLVLFVFVAIITGIWMAVVSEATFEEQTEASDALSSGVTTLGLALLLALTAAVGEEIAFRGALQPVLGLWPTAIIFALTHAQYSFTPAWLIILGVALGFGWIRQRYNTTIAMITHFAYNFIPLAITVYAPEETALWLHRIF